MSKLASYLAKNYLSASTDPSTKQRDYDIDTRPKKKRRKDRHTRSSAGTGGLIIADDAEELGLSRRRNNADDEEDEDGRPVYDSNVKSAEFRRKKDSAWKSVDHGISRENGAGGPQRRTEIDEEADKILRDAADENTRRKKAVEDEDRPTVVEDAGDSGMKMSSGARAGLQTAADTARMVEEEEQRAQEERERERMRKKKSKSSKLKSQDHEVGEDETNKEEETIYRDATGRRIDISLRRAELRAQELAKIQAEKKAREEAMGDVQRKQKEQRQIDLEDAQFLTLGRTADDEEMNDRLKKEIRADDPMAQYMLSRRGDGNEAEMDLDENVGAKGKRRDGKKIGDEMVVSRSQVKMYQGHAPPNRYGIVPGWRWDGVDRGNGFEKKWFQARSQKSRNEKLEYEWQMDE